MKVFDLQTLIRPSVARVKPYSSARDEFHGQALVYIDANENPNPTAFNRYPDPHQHTLKQRLSEIKQVPEDQLFIGNGSDEVIDLILRAFCEPGLDQIIVCQPTYGMYAVSAAINNVEVIGVSLEDDYDMNVAALAGRATERVKVIFLCSPNNPTGNLLSKGKVIQLIQQFRGLVVIDEAYIDFSEDMGFVPYLSQYPNLIILQTLSKAWGLAGLRLGIGIASPSIVGVLNRIKPPYNISSVSQELALKALANEARTRTWISEIIKERKRLEKELIGLPGVEKVHPSDANFLLVKVEAAKAAYQYLISRGIVVRDRSDVALCGGCLRITVGTPHENDLLLQAWRQFLTPHEK